MKSIIITLALILAINFQVKADPGVNNMPQQIQASFHQAFKQAEVTSWSYFQGVYKVSFSYFGQAINAFFTQEGELKATSRNMLSTQLPLHLNTELKLNYGNYWISDLFEFNMDNSTTYYVTINSADYKIVLKSVGNNWVVYNKTKLFV